MPAYKPILTKGNESELSNTYENGKLRFTLDTRRIFLDIVGGRLEFTDFVKDKTEQQILSTLAPLPKVYIASDTKKFYAYDSVTSNWIVLNDRVAHAVNADTATYAKNAGTATYATNSGTSAYGTKSGTATYATSAGTANFASAPADNSDWDFGDIDDLD